jgi:AraC-like DNA-binding protein
LGRAQKTRRNFVQDISAKPGKHIFMHTDLKDHASPHKAVVGAKTRERARVWRPPLLAGVELLQARYQRQNFSKHFHECFAVGVMRAGAMRFDYRGGSHLAAPGEINLCLAGEAHNGEAAHEAGWRYRMFYLDEKWLNAALAETGSARRGAAAPFFRSGVLQDPKLAAELLHLHRSLEPGRAGALEQESRLLMALHHLISRHAQPRPPERKAAACLHAVRLARDYLAANLERNPSLGELGRVAGLSRFHLLRVFSRQVGLTPHAFMVQLRLQKARALLQAGASLAEAALLSGFSDQSHLSRHFKKVYGLTPGQYRASLQGV